MNKLSSLPHVVDSTAEQFKSVINDNSDTIVGHHNSIAYGTEYDGKTIYIQQSQPSGSGLKNGDIWLKY